MEALVRKIHWVESSKGRSADTAEALLPATRYRADYWVPAVSDDSLDHVAGCLSEQFVAVIVDELRERYDDNERRESEARYLYNATEVKHARAVRSWKDSCHASPRPLRDSVEQSLHEEHQAAVRAAIEAACHEMGGPVEPVALALDPDERNRLALRLTQKWCPFTTRREGKRFRQPTAVSDATFAKAEAAASTRRVAETLVALRSRERYTARERAESERSYNSENDISPEEAPYRLTTIVDTAWRMVDRYEPRAARGELARLDRAHDPPKRRKAARRRRAQVPGGTDRGRPRGR